MLEKLPECDRIQHINLFTRLPILPFCKHSVLFLNLYFNLICTRMKLEPLNSSLCNMLGIKYRAAILAAYLRMRFELVS
jgi:hypothetical protein